MFDEDTLAAAAGPAGSGRYRHYRLGALLGKGGMGEVVSAEDPEIGRHVAIKRMRSAEPALVDRFIREARIQGQLEHPAIVPVHELGKDDTGAPVIVMKQLRGTTLADVLRTGTAPRQRLLRTFVDVCLAVELAHSRGIVHRDLKPANIMLGDFGEVYVIDWGLARLPGDDDAGVVMGTPGYMPPEQERGDADVDARADVFALGRVLRDLVGNADAPELSAAAARASAPDRADRFASARELAEVVERVLDGDRDLAQRQKLAQTLLAEARAATERRDQIRAAGRALALDPENPEIAGLVAQLMLEPPKVVPPEVDRAVEDEIVRGIESQRRNAVAPLAGYLLLLPILYWAGFRDPWFQVVGLATVALTFASRWLVVDRGRYRGEMAAVFVGALCVMNVWGCMYLSPWLVLPTTLVATSRVIVQPRLAPSKVVLLLMLLTLTIPAVLELLGITRRTIDVVGSDLVLHMRTSTLDPAGVAVWAGTTFVLSLFAIYITGRTAAAADLASRRAIHLQAWQLRQLVT